MCDYGRPRDDRSHSRGAHRSQLAVARAEAHAHDCRHRYCCARRQWAIAVCGRRRHVPALPDLLVEDGADGDAPVERRPHDARRTEGSPWRYARLGAPARGCGLESVTLAVSYTHLTLPTSDLV